MHRHQRQDQEQHDQLFFHSFHKYSHKYQVPPKQLQRWQMVYGTAHKQMAAVNNSKVCVGVDKVVFSMKKPCSCACSGLVLGQVGV